MVDRLNSEHHFEKVCFEFWLERGDRIGVEHPVGESPRGEGGGSSTGDGAPP